MSVDDITRVFPLFNRDLQSKPGLATPRQDSATYKHLVETMLGHAISTMDADGFVTSWNAGAQRAKGYEAKDIIGRHFACFYTEEDQAAQVPLRALSIARDTGVFEDSGWRVRQDGTQFWAEAVIEPMFDPDRVFLGFTNIVRDCTAQHDEIAKTMERDRQFRHLVYGIKDYAVYMLDLAGLVVNWNIGAEKAKGYTADEIVGRHFSCFYTDEDLAAGLPAKALAIARSEGRFEAEGWRVRKDGTRLWAQVMIDLIADDAGHPIGFAKITKDRTEQRQTQASMLESERRFRHLVQGVTDYAIYMLDPDGLVTNWNAGAARAKGYTAEEIVGQHFSRFFTPEDRALDLPTKALATALEVGRFEAEGWRLRKDGSRFWAHVVIDLIRDEHGALIGFAKITRDTTRQKEDADRLIKVTRTLDLALSNMKHGLCVFDRHEVLQLANSRFVEMFHSDGARPLIGLKFEQIMDLMIDGGPRQGEEPMPADLIYTRHRQLIRRKSEHSTVETFPSGRAVAISHAPLPDGAWVSTFEDVTESERAQATIAQLASQDSLTGLANRRAFNSGIATLTANPQSRGHAVMLIDLDDFKAVNDQYGHGAGDRVLLHVADSIQSCIRIGDLAARLGGDEFAIVLANCPEAEALGVAQRLLGRIQAPASVGPDVVIQVGVSIGIVMARPSDSEPELLLNLADLALYDAKADGKAAFRLYTHDMSAKLRQQRILEQDLRDAVQTGTGFELHYQPLLNVSTGQIVGREALLRWTHPRHGMTPPSVFIPIAERLGLIQELGGKALEWACTDAARWTDGARVAVNVSPEQLGAGEFSHRVEAALAASGLPSRQLEIEVTETTLVDDGSGKLEDLHRVRDLGVSVALDDFGIGFSSLSLVRAFPFNRIKIDGSFVRDAVLRADCAAIVGVVVDLGRRLGITVVAEGVETERQMELVRSQGCDEVQGNLFGRPLPYA